MLLLKECFILASKRPADFSAILGEKGGVRMYPRMVKATRRCSVWKSHDGTIPFVAVAIFRPGYAGVPHREWDYFIIPWWEPEPEPKEVQFPCENCYVEEQKGLAEREDFLLCHFDAEKEYEKWQGRSLSKK